MKQGIMHPTRVRLLLSTGHSCYRPRRDGERKRKSVRGCIVGMDLSVLALSIVKQGDDDIPGLTNESKENRLGPKRATKIRKFFGLSKDDDVSVFLGLIAINLSWTHCFSERKLESKTDTSSPTGSQIRRPPNRSAQGRRQEILRKSSPHPAPCHSSTPPT